MYVYSRGPFTLFSFRLVYFIDSPLPPFHFPLPFSLLAGWQAEQFFRNQHHARTTIEFMIDLQLRGKISYDGRLGSFLECYKCVAYIK